MGSHANTRLAAAVANAGGLGMVSVYGDYGGPPENVAKMLERTREQTSGVFGANFIMKWVEPVLAHKTVKAAAEHANVVEFFYTDPDAALIEIVHAAGALACWQVGSREEAVAAVAAGCDFVVAQGIEAGGHVRGTFGLLALLDQVLSAVDVPVVAAGGIGTARALAAVLAAGADGVRVGTRFLAVEEAEAHPDYVQALIAAEAEDTIYTDAFSVGWPHAPHRVLRSSLEAAQAFQGEFVGTMADTWDAQPYQLPRLGCAAIHKSATGNVEAMPQWAGESVGGLKKVQTAAEIIHELTSEAEMLLRRWS
jgi:NAD(P)H-dependent flavin oxidoreductase YrpB (nitropropane dioxygenase family)